MKKRPDFKSLWQEAMRSAKDSGDKSLASLLENSKEKKEFVCRRLGIISSIDIQRLKRSRKIKSFSRKSR